MTTPRKLTIAAVILLVCGVIVALVVRRPAHRVTVSLVSLHTNIGGTAIASLMISNANEHDVNILIEAAGLGGSSDFLTLGGRQARSNWMNLPAHGPRQIVAKSAEVHTPGKLSHRLRRLLATRVSSRFWPRETVTLDIP